MADRMDGVFAVAIGPVEVPWFPAAIADVNAEGVNVDLDFVGLGLDRESQRGQKAQGRDAGDQDFAEHGTSSLCWLRFARRTGDRLRERNDGAAGACAPAEALIIV
jgi:hypothetical protein